MFKINEKSIIGIGLVNGLDSAMDNFLQINKVKFGKNTTDPFALFYRDFEDLISESNKLYDGEIEIFYLSENIDLDLLDTFLTLIKRQTYPLGLRILRKQNFLYIYLDRIINKEIYIVEDFNEQQKLKNTILARKK